MRPSFRAALLAWLVVVGAACVGGESPDGALPAIETVDFDQHAGFRVNGQPFFPILLYGAPTDEVSLAQLREFGFNTLACRAEDVDAVRTGGFYAAVHGRKPLADTTGVLLAMSIDSPVLNLKKDLFAQLAEYNSKRAADVPQRPVVNAIGYWEDEPAGVIAGKLPSKETYDDVVKAIDVAAPYLYPVPYQPVSTVGDAVARARAVSGGTKPVLPILQLFSWDPSARYPTPAELRCMTYLALIEGANGVGYYSYNTVTGKTRTPIAEVAPELWKSVEQLNHEVAEIGPLLLDRADTPAVALDGAAKDVKLKAGGGKTGLPVVLVNTAATPQRAKLVAADAHAAGQLVLDGGRQIELAGGTAELKLEPFEVVVIRRIEQP